MLMLFIVFFIFLFFFYVKWRKSRYQFSKELEKCESPIEVRLMEKFYHAGLKPYAQVPCGAYRIDIALFIKGKKIAIECDGKEFHSSPEQIEHDQIKDSVLRKNKWQVFRFTGREIYKDPDWCLKVIRKRFKLKEK